MATAKSSMNSAAVIGPGAFWNREAEWQLLQPLVGDSMLEAGCKFNGLLTYKGTFEALGILHVSVDINGLHGSLKKDLREPLGLGAFSLVTNFGCSEHVVDRQASVWENLVGACDIGSVLISTTPMPGQWLHHGFFHPYGEFYSQLASLNGFDIERLYTSGIEPRQMWFCRMVRHSIVPFVMPDPRTMHFNVHAAA